MKFSIVTPVLNGARFLEAAIKSIRGQSHGEFEHIIIDAGSTDGSAKIAAEAARADGRVTVHARPGEKLYPSLLWGLGQAKGDMLAWLNADDLYVPWAMEAVAGYCARHPDAQWVSGLPACWDEAGVMRYLRLEAWRPRALIRRGWFHKDLLGFIQQESVFFSRRLFGSLGPDERRRFGEARLAGDFILWKSFAEKTRLDVIPAALGGFRRHGANTSALNMDAYMAEVKEAGGYFLPPPLRAAARFAYAGAARRMTARAVRGEERVQAGAEDAAQSGKPEHR